MTTVTMDVADVGGSPITMAQTQSVTTLDSIRAAQREQGRQRREQDRLRRREAERLRARVYRLQMIVGRALAESGLEAEFEAARRA